MSKLTRKFLKLFGSTASTGPVGTGQITTYGSFAAGTGATSTDPTVIQSISQWLEGWFAAVDGNNAFNMEDMNAYCYVIAYMLCSIFQDGVPVYEANTTYFVGSVVNDGTGKLFTCWNDASGAGISGIAPTNAANWTPQNSTAGNSILNGALDFFQRGFTTAVANNPTRTFSYVADRWATWCSAGTASVATGSQQTPTLPGSAAALQIAYTTPPSSAVAVGCQLFQVLDTIDSLPYYNAHGSFGVNVKALGNVTQIGLQFIYNTTNTGVGAGFTTIGAQVLTTISTSGFTLAQILGQAMGTAQTTAGVVGIMITATAVSSGHLSDSGNGFLIEQAMMVPGGSVPSFKRAHTSTASELAAIQAYYEKTFDVNVAPADSVAGSAYLAWYAPSTIANGADYFYNFKVTKRAQPAVAFYNPFASSASKIRDLTSSTNIATTLPLIGETGVVFGPTGSSYTAADLMATQLAADAEIY